MSLWKKKLRQAKTLVFGESEGTIIELTMKKGKVIFKRAKNLLINW